jgi:hypothetical protein
VVCFRFVPGAALVVVVKSERKPLQVNCNKEDEE